MIYITRLTSIWQKNSLDEAIEAKKSGKFSFDGKRGNNWIIEVTYQYLPEKWYTVKSLNIPFGTSTPIFIKTKWEFIKEWLIPLITNCWFKWIDESEKTKLSEAIQTEIKFDSDSSSFDDKSSKYALPFDLQVGDTLYSKAYSKNILTVAFVWTISEYRQTEYFEMDQWEWGGPKETEDDSIIQCIIVTFINDDEDEAHELFTREDLKKWFKKL